MESRFWCHFHDPASDQDHQPACHGIPPRRGGVGALGLTLATAAALAILGSIQLLGANTSAVLEISYSLFVALFSVLLFKGHMQLPVLIGGAFIFLGSAIIVLAR